MSDAPKKKSAKTNQGSPGAMALVRDVAAHASHLNEVVAIVRAASAEYVNRFAAVGSELPELLLEREGSGARPATIEALVDAGLALEGIARELEARANALLSSPVASDDIIDSVHTVSLLGSDRVVRRDHLDRAVRPKVEGKRPI